jgi:transposase
MYIAITRKKYKNTYHEQILIRESYREDGKVKTRTIANLTGKPQKQVDAIVAALKHSDEPTITTKNQEQGFTVGLSSVIIFIMTILGILKAIGDTFEAKVAMLLIAARITIQSSRIQALNWAKNEDKILDLLKFTNTEKDKLNNKTIYLGLDYMEENQTKIEDKLFKSYYGKNPPKKVFYDVTSSYVTGDYDDSELVTYGYNRDKKKGTQQIVIGLLTDENGHAISIHTYPGNTNDVTTFTDQLDKLKNRFKLENITVVGDGGMIKSEDIIKVKELGYDYITSIGKPSIQKLIDNKDSQIQMSLFDEDLQEVIENDIRYIVRQNPIRRDEIRETRESKIKRLEEFINDKKEYYNTHYRAKKETLLNNIDKKISSLKLSKFISYNITYKDEDITIKNNKGEDEIKTKAMASIEIIIDPIAKKEVEQLDGCYVVTTSLIDTSKDTKEEIHKAYKTLIKVENAFKMLKTEFLEIRPLYIKTDKRIKGHVALSMLAYNISLKIKNYTKLAKLDFKDTIRKLSAVKTVINTINSAIKFETIPTVCENLIKIFDQMKFKLPTKI